MVVEEKKSQTTRQGNVEKARICKKRLKEEWILVKGIIDR